MKRGKPCALQITPNHRRRHCSGFSLLELLIVVVVILSMMAVSYPIFTCIHAKAQVHATKALVQGVATLIKNLGPTQNITATNGVSCSPWTLGQRSASGALLTTEIDGDPASYPLGDPSPLPALARSTYHGLASDGHELQSSRVNAKKQFIDAWGQPLHLSFDPKRFSDGFGVWSNGPDRQTAYPADTGASLDDIRSWGPSQGE
jgi:prepilin-type N-terminal cleavage/methylation domain-containing protein